MVWSLLDVKGWRRLVCSGGAEDGGLDASIRRPEVGRGERAGGSVYPMRDAGWVGEGGAGAGESVD